MSKMKIEDGVPLPPSKRGAGHKIYPIDELECGQSFFVPGKSSRDINGPVHRVVKKTGRKFAIRKVDGGVRVWRVS